MQSCQENGVELIYAISPGVDMTYSSEEEMSLLEAKVQQVGLLLGQTFATV